MNDYIFSRKEIVMGFFSGTKIENPEEFVNDFLFEGESVVCTYKLVRNFVSLTDKRIIFVNKSLLSREIVIRSIPYTKINSISLERKNKLFSFSDKIEVVGKGKQYELKISKSENVFDFYNILAQYICN
jgi:hypothetical protein